MKVVAFSGSPRCHGNTERMINRVFAILNNEGIDTELVQIGGKPLYGCTACMKCFENEDLRCANNSDELNQYARLMIDADGIILASPTYFADITSEMKALIDRAGMIGRANGDPFQRKVGASIVVARRGGAIHAFDTLNHFFLVSQMIIPGSSYWNMGYGRNPGDVDKDGEAMNSMDILGTNMAWLLKKIRE